MQRKPPRYERYEFEHSPWMQNPTQRDLATLLSMTKSQLEALVRDKEVWTLRKEQEINGKMRNLAIPRGKLRSVHERLKFHLDKIKQPSYLFSPRKGFSQRDNALLHLGQHQFLKIDIRQFYPSTSGEHIFRWAHHVAGLRSDVAGLLKHLVAIDDKMPFGSPVSPVLMTHVHRPMFDAINSACQTEGLKMSLWVDDLAISGSVVPGRIIEQVRGIISRNGLRSHKVEYRFGGRPVTITGIPIYTSILAPRALHDRIKAAYEVLYGSETDLERCDAIDRLLSHLGTHRYLVGAKSPEGRKLADRMNVLRRCRASLDYSITTGPEVSSISKVSDPENLDQPF
jgi:RNA-directed DNA polymerase